MITRFFKGLGALIVLLAVLGGIPAFLALAIGNPIPTGAQWHQMLALEPDYGNTILLTKLLPCAAWAAWALFAIPWLYELLTRSTGHEPRRAVWLFRGQQKMAAVLIAAVLLMFAGAGSLAASAPASAAEPTAAAAIAQHLQPRVASMLLTQHETATPAAAEHATTRDYTVKPGDTLWAVAEHYLGHGQDYPEIAQASGHITQSDGRHLTDPDLIYPGWKLEIPGVSTPAAPASAPAAPAAPAPAPHGSSSSHAPGAGHSAAAANNDAGSRIDQEVQSESNRPHENPADRAPSADTTADPGSDFTIPLATAGGIAGLLAAGLLVALGRRRLHQRRRRRTGERIAMPEPAAADFELELRAVENPLGHEDVDNVLRGLQIWAEDTGAQLPELLAVRLDGEEIAMYLTKPAEAELPAPFERASSDGTAWIVRPGTAFAPSRPAVSPYPALTTIGVDAHHGHLMLDLEQIGSLSIVGDDPELGIGVLNAMAVELASNSWSEGVRVTLVGLPLDLARDIDRFRIQHVDDVAALVRNLRADLDDRRAALDSYGVSDVHDARARATELEGWAPHIVILAQAPTGELRAELAELVARLPRLGVATIATSEHLDASATITVHDREAAEYHAPDASIPALPFRPQILDGEELELIQSLFSTTELEAHPLDLVSDETPVSILEPVLLPVDQVVDDERRDAVDELSATTAASDVDEPVPAETNMPAAAQAAPVVDDAADADGVDEDGVVEDGRMVSVPDWPAPYVRLLGPIDALNLADPGPGRGVELMAYLLLQSGPVPGAQIQKALWPDKLDPKNNNLRTLAKQLRASLGNDPEGNPLLPEGRNNVGFAIHPAIRSDWDDFRALIGPDLSTTSNEDLVAAIRLVRGAPFTGASSRRGWWVWRAIAEEEMTAAILDAAEELAERALSTGDTETARAAAKTAQAADPLNEAGWRLELRTALRNHDMDEFNRVVDELYVRVGGTDPNYELDDTTQELVDAAQTALSESS